jgi:mRNA interferase RelE/StbE
LACEIRFKESVARDLKRLDPPVAAAILQKLETVLAQSPGKDKQLTGDFTGLYSWRTGDYRVIYSLHGETILVLRIAHRKDAYK